MVVQVNVLVFEKENLEDLPTYDQIYASDIVRSMYIRTHVLVCVFACCMLQCSSMPHAYACTGYACCIGVYDASVCLMPTRKTQMKKMQTTRAVLKTVHC